MLKRRKQSNEKWVTRGMHNSLQLVARATSSSPSPSSYVFASKLDFLFKVLFWENFGGILGRFSLGLAIKTQLGGNKN